MPNIPVPHLTTALQGPLQQLEKHFLEEQVRIECWLRQEWLKTKPPIYGSVDLRNAGFKLAPVDMNLFPAGFNNLNPAFKPLCIQAIQETIEKCSPHIMKVLLVPENHTRNLFYLESLFTLQEIILKAGFEVKIGSLAPEVTEEKTMTLPSGNELTFNPITRLGDEIMIKDFKPCLIWLNNDLSSGIPEILKGIRQTIRPPVCLGWSHRLKSQHFSHYQKVAEEFSQYIQMDPWLINPLFRSCDNVNFLEKEGMDILTQNANLLFQAIQEKYREYKISHPPFLIIKADMGTYGMNVMTIRNPEEIVALNRKQRTKMATGKEGRQVTRVILQEGIYTFETIGKEKVVAEPVIYMIGQYVVGGFYRIHKNKGVMENLNSPGMQFEPLAFTEPCNNPDQHLKPDACPNRFYAYGVIARLSLLAAAREEANLKCGGKI